VIVLIVCFAIAHTAGEAIIDSPLRRMIEESFLILGWVANWRPLEIFCTIGGPSLDAAICISVFLRQLWKSNNMEQISRTKALL
jgi:hypothetical protein